jgi:hypothetical protein
MAGLGYYCFSTQIAIISVTRSTAIQPPFASSFLPSQNIAKNGAIGRHMQRDHGVPSVPVQPDAPEG